MRNLAGEEGEKGKKEHERCDAVIGLMIVRVGQVDAF